MILLDGQKQTRKTFRAYEPPIYTRPTYAFQRAWEETGEATGAEDEKYLVPAARHLPTIGGWPKWDSVNDAENEDEQVELVVCDGCGATVHWEDAEFENDPNADGITWTMCRYCTVSDVVTDDPAAVNAAILAEDDDE
jgi:hypothetical protein